MALRYDTSISEYGMSVLKISYPGCEVIELDLSDLFKDLSHFTTLYDPINEYLTTIPEYLQRQVYDIYYRLYVNDYKNNFEDPTVLTKIEVKIKQVTEILGYQNFKIWTRQQSDRIIYPDTIQNDYIHDPDMNTTLEKTYVKREYTDLIALAMFVRALAPLYVDFYNRIKQVTPHYYYKIFMLLVRSDIAESEEINKLRTYIDVSRQTLISGNKNENIILFAGLADDDILDSLLSEIVFNKLLTIDFFNKKCNIISFIYTTIKYKGNYAPSGGQNIRGKNTDTNSKREDVSYFEDYRKTTTIPLGTVVEIQHSLSDIHMLVSARGLGHFDYEAYQRELDNIGFYLQFKLEEIQIYLLGWFMAKMTNPRSLFYIEHRKVIELMLFAKLVLISEGKHYMAMVLCARKSTEPGYLSPVIKNSLNKQSLKRLSNIYSTCLEEDKQSVVEKTILEASKTVSNTTWIAVGTPEQIRSVSTVGGFLETPANINDVMLDYVEFVNQRVTHIVPDHHYP